MNYLLVVCALFSSLSFLYYTVAYFTSPHMKSEFERFELKELGIFIIILELLGALGLLAGLFYQPLLLLSSGGLALLMFLGLMTRLKYRDSFRVSAPAIFYMLLNGFVFYIAIVA